MTMAVVLQRHRPCFCNADRGPIDIPTPNGRYVGNIDERLRMADEFGPDGLCGLHRKGRIRRPGHRGEKAAAGSPLSLPATYSAP